jgi:hypothetical protein
MSFQDASCPLQATDFPFSESQFIEDKAVRFGSRLATCLNGLQENPVVVILLGFALVALVSISVASSIADNANRRRP